MSNEVSLKTKEKVAYGIGAIGKDWVYALVSGFLLIYFNTVIGVSGVFTGVLFMVTRVFDAFNDPFMGVIVEKTRTKMGKFRPWLLIGTLLNAVVLYAMFAVPEGLTTGQTKVYISVAYILWGMTYTIMDIPYWSMIPAITKSGKDRENISVIARSCAGVGAAIATALTALLIGVFGGGNERLGYKLYAGMVAVFFVVTILITVFNVREKVVDNKKAVSVKEMLLSLIHNDQAMVVVIGIIVFNASPYLTQSLATYFFKYDIGNYSLYGLFATVGGASQILSMMTFPLFRKKMETKKVLLMAIVITIVGYVGLFLASLLSIAESIKLVLLCIIGIVIFFGFGLATVITTIFLADTVDYGEWKNGNRNESITFSLQTFVVKLASAISGLIAGVSIDLIKLDPNAAIQQTSTLIGLRTVMTIIPMLGLVFSIIFFMKKYILTEDKLNEITRELGERR